jgi:hypothetical protein
MFPPQSPVQARSRQAGKPDAVLASTLAARQRALARKYLQHPAGLLVIAATTARPVPGKPRPPRLEPGVRSAGLDAQRRCLIDSAA